MADVMKGFGLLMALAMLFPIGQSALTLLAQSNTITWHSHSQVAQEPAIDWLRPDQVYVPDGLVISAHAAKHNGDTERIYQHLLEGQCAEVAKLCGGSEEEFAYYCKEPVTGIVGAILQVGDEITTGFYERGGSGYWVKRIPREHWRVCR